MLYKMGKPGFTVSQVFHVCRLFTPEAPESCCFVPAGTA
jgi:hypothetical protein